MTLSDRNTRPEGLPEPDPVQAAIRVLVAHGFRVYERSAYGILERPSDSPPVVATVYGPGGTNYTRLTVEQDWSPE